MVCQFVDQDTNVYRAGVKVWSLLMDWTSVVTGPLAPSKHSISQDPFSTVELTRYSYYITTLPHTPKIKLVSLGFLNILSVYDCSPLIPTTLLCLLFRSLCLKSRKLTIKSSLKSLLIWAWLSTFSDCIAKLQNGCTLCWGNSSHPPQIISLFPVLTILFKQNTIETIYWKVWRRYNSPTKQMLSSFFLNYNLHVGWPTSWHQHLYVLLDIWLWKVSYHVNDSILVVFKFQVNY